VARYAFTVRLLHSLLLASCLALSQRILSHTMEAYKAHPNIKPMLVHVEAGPMSLTKLTDRWAVRHPARPWVGRLTTSRQARSATGHMPVR